MTWSINEDPESGSARLAGPGALAVLFRKAGGLEAAGRAAAAGSVIGAAKAKAAEADPVRA